MAARPLDLFCQHFSINVHMTGIVFTVSYPSNNVKLTSTGCIAVANSQVQAPILL